MPEWSWEYDGYDPAEERLREALCTVGNGYFATRGAAPEATADGVHYPGTYAAGCYNRLLSTVDGRAVESEDMVNLPNWLPLRFRTLPPEGEGPTPPWFSPDTDGLLEYRQCLDLRRGTFTRRMRYADDRGRQLRIDQCRLAHMGDPHLAVLRTEFSAEGWTGEIEVESALDGEVRNAGVARYRELAGEHLTHVCTGVEEPDTVWLRCRTVNSDIRVGMAARTTVTGARPTAASLTASGPRAGRVLRLPVRSGRPVTVDKTVALHTSHDPAISDPLGAASGRVATAPGCPQLLESHHAAWERLWRRAGVDVPGEPGRILRLHLFHVLQTLSPHVAALDVGVPARGLHGEAYRGHVFWDELFVLPYLNLHFPEVSRALLDYRYRRLPEAVRAAREEGRAGAGYPWQSGSDGREESPRLHLNPRSGRWLPDHSRLQQHVGSAVAYNIWRYCEATGDTDYLHSRGVEMLVRIARFWESSAVYDPALERYRIRGVMGPDEFHDGYPDAPAPGLDDNAYTNVTAAWVLARTLDVVRELSEPQRRELFERTDTPEEAVERWEEVSRRLSVPFHSGVISQFDGYERLDELDWEHYRRRYGDVRRLDRILEAEGDTVNRYRASKQADALMLGYLFSPAELAALFRQLGHRLDDETWRRTVDYYLRRTSHGSTLSGLVHGWVLARVRRADAWEFCREALEGDVADLQGGTTQEGIHLGAMGGTLDLVQRGLTGLEIRDGALCFDPAPLPQLSGYSLSLRFRGHWGVRVRVGPDRLRIRVPASAERAIPVVIGGRTVTIAPGESRQLRLPDR
ncbi:glycoside hydrolase family 65 protein [Streptomyces sp. TP-A0874]|uniref:glycoside hydrolase family 65 protein n=1 Tax=Streptomyces sp. TP-A0874 TaxID=549819 RepID=UPI000852FC1F|nr:glycosyl hydrolase family 65 protein [Streptomyces sp. TP-A0874]